VILHFPTPSGHFSYFFSFTISAVASMSALVKVRLVQARSHFSSLLCHLGSRLDAGARQGVIACKHAHAFPCCFAISAAASMRALVKA